ncbi:prepilin-type N-terminal cleavage/methylation domain-containing protein [Shewanella eurypsychrophilus]|uniref:Prepilin-type N-terminal cleavage/methylation domain-containing protein n=1 Tax=Shewanella eurypsychrophilus TaxID=2593656 RepID=A0ABX6V3A8_9GAMM|nr:MULTISPECIES: type IV pilin protein [Shewanella]QFU21789.1 prepilin-type N-terminal cleavage/methylation domain-containing protein [Shewanella sp. YLB-09]QPG57079.1 prepilin-type N-terminal cleavage/methylation domain-containing protein [Shewanella eurypsychrophilus]
MKKNNGFSLIELMIAVSIMGILAAVIYPSYTEYVAKGGRADGISAVMRVANLQEQFYLDNRQYATDMNDLNLGADPFVTDTGLYSVDSTGTTSFIVVATALGKQASRDSACITIQINDIGEKSPAECWE